MGTAAVESRSDAAPVVAADSVTFRYPDPERSLRAVRIYQEVRRPRVGPEFGYADEDARWELTFERPNADRMEYLMNVVDADGNETSFPDPGNDLRAPGAFGDKSVVEWPEYRRPAWLAHDDAGTLRKVRVKSRTLRSSLDVWIWDPPASDPEERLPLLVAHDGPEYAQYSALTTCMAAALEDRRLPPMRLALIAPIERDQIYSASAAYSRALAYEIIPRIDDLAPIPLGRRARVGMGASLGALAMLHLHRTSPAAFGALFLQSGSFFRQRFDKQESGFPRFGRISRFVGTVLTAEEWVHPVPVTMTCGTIEENLKNNRATYDALRRQGYDARMVENRDGHNWVGWRDTFDPHLIDLLARVWG